MDMHKYVPEWVLKLTPYQPGKPIEELERELGLPEIIKLASNENPLGPSKKALASIQSALPKSSEPQHERQTLYRSHAT